MKIGEKIRKIIPIVTILFSSFTIGIGSSKFKSTQISAYSQILSKVSLKNYQSKAYISFNSDHSTVSSLFSSTYTSNFSNYYTEIISFLDSSKSFIDFDFSCSNTNMNFVKGCDTRTYSNQVDLKRFETININLYKTPNVSEELNTFDLDGFVYIPDYIADLIIKNDQNLNSYLDLVPDLSKFEIKKRNEFLSKYAVSLSFNHEVYRLKISNIFHVKGFNDPSYTYNDGLQNSGKLLNVFLGDYVILSCTKLNQFGRSLISCFDSKRFIFEQELTKYYNFSDSDSFSIDSFNVQENQGSSHFMSFNNDTFEKTGVINVIFLVLGILIIISFLTYEFKRSNRLLNKKEIMVFSFIPCILIEFIMQMLYLTVFNTNYNFLVIYNILFSLPLLIIAILDATFFFKRVTK